MEENKIRKLFDRLCEQNKFQFPKLRTKLDAPTTQGVYVIRCSAGKVMHVGRSVRGREGLAQRLGNHLRGQSSFAKSYLKGNGRLLREGYTYQYLVVADNRARALLEHLAVGELCPEHLGLGTGK